MEELISSKLFSDVGMGEVFMSRLFDFHTNILNGLFNLANKKEIKAAIFGVIFDGLEPAFRSLRVLRIEWLNALVPEKKKKQDIENVYSYLTIALKDRFQEVTKLMGYDIGFLFQLDDKFEAGCKNFLELHPKINPEFIKILRYIRKDWLGLMIRTRNNAIEHAARSGFELRQELGRSMTLESVETLFDNCWRTMEDFLIVFAIDSVDPIYGQEILELSEYQKDSNFPRRFGWYII